MRRREFIALIRSGRRGCQRVHARASDPPISMSELGQSRSFPCHLQHFRYSTESRSPDPTWVGQERQ